MPAKLRLNVFSPLPPLRTEIANYISSILPWLGQLADVTVWTSQENWNEITADGVQVRGYQFEDMPWSRVNDADATIFNFGNNTQFHRDIFRVANLVPGVCILHDIVLQHFFAGLAVGYNWRNEYLDAMRRHHGPEAARDAARLLSGQIGIDLMVPRYDLALAVAERSLGLVCHNSDGANALRARTRLPVYDVDLAMDISGIPDPVDRVFSLPYRIAIFGFLGPNRRLQCILQALAESPARGSFRLNIFGEIDDKEELRQTIVSLGVESLVQLHGFVEPAVLDRALANAHLAINLRHPTMGEASASQLRIWAHALPSIVTRAGWYATLPTEAVFFVNPGDEVEGIKHLLAQFLASPGTYEAAGRCGRRMVETRHTPLAYVETLIEIARHAPVLHGYRTAIDLARKTSQLLSSITDIDGVAHAAPTVAAGIAGLMCEPTLAAKSERDDGTLRAERRRSGRPL